MDLTLVGVRMWIGWIWLRTRSSGGFLRTW